MRSGHASPRRTHAKSSRPRSRPKRASATQIPRFRSAVSDGSPAASKRTLPASEPTSSAAPTTPWQRTTTGRPASSLATVASRDSAASARWRLKTKTPATSASSTASRIRPMPSSSARRRGGVAGRGKTARVQRLSVSQAAFLRDNPFVGAVTTVRADGGLHTTVVWVDAEDGNAVFTTQRTRAKGRHLAHDPRVSLLVVDPANTYRWLAVAGRAELSEDHADARLDAYARRYLGRESFPWREPGQTWVDCVIGADRIEASGIE